jgi:LDH2 family malate/lactate/ureidoglycolate dehydrogenase
MLSKTIVRSISKRQCQGILSCHASTTSENSKNSDVNQNEKIIPKDELFSFIVRCMLKVGTRPSHAETLADNLTMADYRGHYSHGLNRLDMYVNDIKNGTTASDGDPIILKQSPGTALVDGQNLLGPYVGKYCMNIAMEKAKNIGIGLVAARRSNHFGIAGYYSLKAVDKDLIGWAFTNTSPLVVPTRSKSQSLGTNPIAFGAPAKDGDSFVLDMATSTVALGKVEISQRRGSEIPNTWGVNEKGIPVTKPNEVRGLLALGGPEESSGYKGYGLSMMVEILCGILSGSHFGPWIRSWKSGNTEANLGQCFIAINPNAFEDDFEERLQKLINYCRALPPSESGKPVLIAGDPERKHMAKCDKLGGIPYPQSQIDFIHELARSLKIEIPTIQ